MLLDLEKVKQLLSEFILLRPAEIPAQALRLLGDLPFLPPALKKHPTLSRLYLLFYSRPPPPGCHYLRMPEVPTHTTISIILQVEKEKAVFCGLLETHFTLLDCDPFRNGFTPSLSACSFLFL